MSASDSSNSNALFHTKVLWKESRSLKHDLTTYQLSPYKIADSHHSNTYNQYLDHSQHCTCTRLELSWGTVCRRSKAGICRRGHLSFNIEKIKTNVSELKESKTCYLLRFQSRKTERSSLILVSTFVSLK